MDVKDSNGNVTRWHVECGGVSFFRRSGLNQKLPAGTDITVDGYLSRGRSNYADGVAVTFKDGRRVALSGIVVKDGQAIRFGKRGSEQFSESA